MQSLWRGWRRWCLGGSFRADGGEAGRAVDRIAVARNEGNGRSLPAFSANDLSHGAGWQPELCLACGSTLGAAGGNIDERPILVELLFTSCPDKRTAAFAARKRLVHERHRMTPSARHDSRHGDPRFSPDVQQSMIGPVASYGHITIGPCRLQEVCSVYCDTTSRHIGFVLYVSN